MKGAESTARHSLGELGNLTSAATATEVTRASVALDRFMTSNAEIVRLSRANSNVCSLALELSLNSRRLGPSR